MNVFEGTLLLQAVSWALLHLLWQGSAVALFIVLVVRALPRGSVGARPALFLTGVCALILAPILSVIVAMSKASAGSSGSGVIQELALWIALAWCLGMLLFLLRLVIALIWVLRVPSRVPSARSLAVLRSAAQRLGLDGKVELRTSRYVDGPAVLGFRKPRIVIPERLEEAPISVLEPLLAHELAHIAANDPIVMLVARLTEAALFFHPASWWLVRSLSDHLEYRCDDRAVAACGDTALYVRAFLGLEEMRSCWRTAALPASASPLASRMRRLLSEKPPGFGRTWLGAIAVACLVLGAGLGVAGGHVSPLSLRANGPGVFTARCAVVAVKLGAWPVLSRWSDESLRNLSDAGRPKLAAYSRGLRSTRRDTAWLQRAAVTGSETVRENAVMALGLTLDPTSARALRAAVVSDDSWRVREKAILALALVEATEAEPWARRLALEDDRKAVRDKALKVLGVLGEKPSSAEL